MGSFLILVVKLQSYKDIYVEIYVNSNMFTSILDIRVMHEIRSN